MEKIDELLKYGEDGVWEKHLTKMGSCENLK